MSWTVWTRVLILAAPAAVAAYDLAAYLAAGNDATVSRAVLAWQGSFAPLALGLAFGWGVLAGHLFLPQHVPAAPPPAAPAP